MADDFNKFIYEQTLLGNVYHAASAAEKVLTETSTTCTGLALSNPVASPVNLVVLEYSFAMTVILTDPVGVGLAISPAVQVTDTTHTTPAVIHNGLMDGSDVHTGHGKADEVATLVGTPVRLVALGSTIGATVTETPGAAWKTEPKGAIILPPGTHISLSFETTAPTGLCYCKWLEVRI